VIAEKMEHKIRKIVLVVIAAIILLSGSVIAASVMAEDDSIILNQEDINQLIEATQSGELGIWSVIYTDMWSRSATDEITTSSTDWVDMPNTSMKIKTPLPTDLVIMFSAGCGTPENPTIFIRCLVDGEQAAPGPVKFAKGSPGSRAFNFYVKKLPAGEHTIKMQWKVDVPEPDSGRAKKRTLNIIANGAGHL